MYKTRYFRIGDIFIYGFFICFFLIMSIITFQMKKEVPTKVEIYVNGKLEYIYPLIKEEKDIFVNTVLGGVNIKFLDNKVRVTSSNSPQKLCVKQGWIQDPGQMIIGVPDRLLIKITGGSDNANIQEPDYILK